MELVNEAPHLDTLLELRENYPPTPPPNQLIENIWEAFGVMVNPKFYNPSTLGFISYWVIRSWAGFSTFLICNFFMCQWVSINLTARFWQSQDSKSVHLMATHYISSWVCISEDKCACTWRGCVGTEQGAWTVCLGGHQRPGNEEGHMNGVVLGEKKCWWKGRCPHEDFQAKSNARLKSPEVSVEVIRGSISIVSKENWYTNLGWTKILKTLPAHFNQMTSLFDIH